MVWTMDASSVAALVAISVGIAAFAGTVAASLVIRATRDRADTRQR